jgi:hypothetical protein
VVFDDPFDSGAVSNSANGFLGGFYGGQLSFDQWYGGTGDASIGGGSLTVGSSFQYRSAVILFAPSTFGGVSGLYNVTVDISGYLGDSNDTGRISVWTASGYDLSNTSADGLFVDTQSGTLDIRGNATASEVAGASFSSSGSLDLQMSYDGTSAVAVFLGAETGGWPFPTIDYDRLTIQRLSGDGSIPEPSVSLLGCLGVLGLLCRRNRSHDSSREG